MSNMANTNDKGTLTGRHVLFLFLAFFGVIFLVNGIFLFRALGTYTGVVSDEPYRKGLAYNERIEADKRQQALGWRHAVTMNLGGRLVISLTDTDGNAVEGATVNATVGRPSTNVDDKTITLAEGRPGTYEGLVGPHAPGNWMVSLAISGAPETTRDGSMARDNTQADVVYRAKERIWLKP